MPVISKVSAEVGGVVGATDACILPRNEQQVMKAKSRSKIAAVPTCSPKDDFAVVMHYAFLEDSDNQFIRDSVNIRLSADTYYRLETYQISADEFTEAYGILRK